MTGHALPAAGCVLALLTGAPGAEKGPATRPAEPSPPTVERIVERANRVAYYQGADGRAKVTMTVTDARGRKRTREMTILRWDQPKPPRAGAAKTKPAEKPARDQDKADEFCGDQKFYVYFHRPADVNKTGFLVWKHLDRDDDRWLYLPALDLVRRISTAQKRTSFVGSHYFYEDISGRNVKDDRHELVNTTKDHYVVRSTPKDQGGVEFAYYKTWILRRNFLVARTAYYDKQRKKYRQYTLTRWDLVQGYPTVRISEMKDLRTGARTVLEYKDVKYNMKLPEKIFTERYLRRAPRRYLK